MTAGAAFSDPPNHCIQPFQVATNQRARLLGAKAVVTCGGLPRGQVSVCLMRIMYVTYMSCVPYMSHTHTQTDMTQFGMAGFAGYYQFCMKFNPVCSCDGSVICPIYVHIYIHTHIPSAAAMGLPRKLLDI
jgi:hypothetical protein